jgi:hypothetical protein
VKPSELRRKIFGHFAGWWRWFTGSYAFGVVGFDRGGNWNALALLAEETKKRQTTRRY